MSQPAERLREAAFDLFERQGYDATTVDQIAELAGVGRTTFFRLFRSKEDVIFPDHTEVLARVRARLSTATVDSTPAAVTEAARLVLDRYLDEGELARSRYRLTRSIPALRAREIGRCSSTSGCSASSSADGRRTARSATCAPSCWPPRRGGAQPRAPPLAARAHRRSRA